MPTETIPIAAAQGSMSAEEADRIIRTSIEEQLAAKGLTKAQDGSAELLVNYFGISKARVEIKDLSYEVPGKYKGVVVREAKLTVDIIEPGNKVVVWRGWSTQDIAGEVEEEAVESLLKEMVKKVLGSFPPKG